MRAPGSILLVAVAAVVAVVRLGGVAAADTQDRPYLVAHEWGTFVSLQGSDGVALDGIQAETESLPAFVHASTRAVPSPFRRFGDGTASVAVRHADGKGETPVIYFYTAREQAVHVHVDFTHGAMTHWYPFANVLLADAALPLDMLSVNRTSLDWNVDLLPSGARSLLQPVADGAPWALARVPDAALIRAHGTDETEGYLFYRGLGRLDLPLRVRGERGGEPCISNGTSATVPAAFLVEMSPTDGRFIALGPITAGGTVRPFFSSDAPMAPRAQVVAQLEQAMRTSLTDAGLFAPEAAAMVRTWSAAWFASPGKRVIYLLPRAATDQIFPLDISPTPTSLVRVLVGRTEFITEADEQHVASLLIERLLPDRRDHAMRELAGLGRFLEPAVRRARAVSTVAAVRRSADQVLAAYP